ncbi:MAG TPA: response regulator, partial [Marinagarivorans sp.]
NAMGGDVWFTSELGKGSCFSFKVLLHKSERPEMVTPDIELRGRRILLVDDNPTNQAIIADELVSLGIEPVLASNANDAMALCTEYAHKGQLFDLALLDRQVPEIGGIKLGKKLKGDSRLAPMPLVMMTSQAQRGEANELTALGFAAYLSRPVSAQTLLAAITVVIDGSLLPHAKPMVTRQFLDNLQLPNAPTPLQPATHQLAQARVLLVDDNSINRDVAKDLLAEFGLATSLACDGREALALLAATPAEQPFELVLMDCQMPGMDGYEATRAIRRGDAGDANRSVVIVAMTANVMRGEKQCCLDAGMNDYLSKPIDVELLELILQKWLGRESTARALFLDSQCTQQNDPLALPADCVILDKDARETAAPSSLAGRDEPAPCLVWDMPSALKRVRGRPERLMSLIDSYSEKSPEIITDLYQKIESHDLPEAARLCHTLRGIAGNLGGSQLMATAQDLETFCLNKNYSEAERLVGELLVCNHQFINALSDYRHA